MNILGYLRWCARGMIREPLAWGLAMVLLAFAAFATGCPAPWPQALALFGASIMAFTAIYYIIAMSYHQYQREQQDTLDQLRRK